MHTPVTEITTQVHDEFERDRFANSIVDDPMLANDGWWVNGQHRAQARLDAGATVTPFMD